MTGKRDNEGKPDMSLVSRALMRAVSRSMGYGLKKYGRDNYQKGGDKMSYNCIIACLLRHTFAVLSGEDMDEESGLLHTDLMAANVNMLVDLIEREKIVDDRYKG